LATVLANSTAMLDATIVNVALHSSARSRRRVSGLQWVVGLPLTLASFILLGGALVTGSGAAGCSRSAVWFGVASL
jgi:hypothetical protein